MRVGALARAILAALAAGAALAAAPARAVAEDDARRGLFLGGAFAGGFSTSRGDPEAAMRFGARAGLGLPRATIEIQPGYAAIMADGRGSTLRLDAAVNLFPLRRFFLRAGAGLATFFPDRADPRPGFAAVGGAGVEMFSDDRWASGLAVSYEPEFYRGDAVWHQAFATVTITRY